MASVKRLFGAAVRLLAATSPSSYSDRLPYEHGYHAGNYADVVKHAALVQLLREMTRKGSPFVYAETHSGAGGYPLSSGESARLAEHERGISALLRDRRRSAEEEEEEDRWLHPSAVALLEIVERRRAPPSSSSSSGGGDDRDSSSVIYPGSPMIASSLCRDRDSLLFCERDAGQFGLLRENLGAPGMVDGDDRVTLLREDGYKALKRFENLDPGKRALVFVDPPYQMGSDSEQIASLVGFLRTHWRSARVAIWHPASGSNRGRADRLYRLVKEALDGRGGGSGAELLATELHDETVGSVGTGMLLVNPPFGIDEELESLYSSLGEGLAGGRGKPEIMVRRL